MKFKTYVIPDTGKNELFGNKETLLAIRTHFKQHEILKNCLELIQLERSKDYGMEGISIAETKVRRIYAIIGENLDAIKQLEEGLNNEPQTI